jgi:hypothetical protein
MRLMNHGLSFSHPICWSKNLRQVGTPVPGVRLRQPSLPSHSSVPQSLPMFAGREQIYSNPFLALLHFCLFKFVSHFGFRISDFRPSRPLLLPLLGLLFLPLSSPAALPKHLVLALDGIAYRDMKALQEGVTYTDLKGRQFHRRAFHCGYFPVSRMVSTYPSASDVAWTEILGDRPLPGYQRTYFNQAANFEIYQNGVTTSMEYERQMTWQVTDGRLRTLGYVFPLTAFKYEVRELVKNFLSATNCGDTFYALLRSPDDAQHLSGDILAMLCTVDDNLQELRARYRASEGRELDILILSDHGNNHAGPVDRVEVRSFLKAAGYRVTKSIQTARDVVLPTAGIESWVEVHNAPSETETLLRLLCHLKGVDVLTARNPNRPDQFIVMNFNGERAVIDWNPARNSFRYSPEAGDPINYRPVMESLSKKGQVDPQGFASADAWMSETFSHRYPLALERIVRGHTRASLNPATILISLDNDYVHSSWIIKKGSELVRFGGTHGGLDDLNSNGILLRSSAPTHDTSANRVAALFNGFAGLRDYRAEEAGAEWVSANTQALTSIPRSPLDHGYRMLPSDQIFLRVWTPDFARVSPETPVEITVKPARRFLPARIRREDPQPSAPSERHSMLNLMTSPLAGRSCERLYAFPSNLTLDPQTLYFISGRAQNQNKPTQIFKFAFWTDSCGLPVAD